MWKRSVGKEAGFAVCRLVIRLHFFRPRPFIFVRSREGRSREGRTQAEERRGGGAAAGGRRKGRGVGAARTIVRESVMPRRGRKCAWNEEGRVNQG